MGPLSKGVARRCCRVRRYEIPISCWRKILQRGHHAPDCDRRPWPGQMGPAHRAWLAVRPLHWLFRDHVVFLFRLAAPLVVGVTIMAVAALLEGLQALTPDRSANLEAALWGAGGTMAAALVAELFVRVWRWRLKNAAE